MLCAEPSEVRRYVDAFVPIEIVEAHEPAARGTAGNAQIVEQPKEVLIARPTERRHGNVERLSVACCVGVSIAAQTRLLLEQRQLEVCLQQVPGREPGRSPSDDCDSLSHRPGVIATESLPQTPPSREIPPLVRQFDRIPR